MKNKITFIPTLKDQTISLKKKIAMEKINQNYDVIVLFPNGEVFKRENKEVVLVNWNCVLSMLDDDRFDVGFLHDGFLYHCQPIFKDGRYESYLVVGRYYKRGEK